MRRLVGLVLNDAEGLIAASPGGQRLRELAEVTFLAGGVEQASAAQRERTVFVLLLRERSAVDALFLSALPNLSFILQTGGHAYHIDAQETARRNVTVLLSRDSALMSLAAVRELTMALMLACLRRLPALAASMRQDGGWPSSTGGVLHGRRLGILGLGRHGKGVAALARAFGMDVVAWRRGRADAECEGDVPFLSLDELLATSDIVSVHLRLSEESKGLLNGQALSKMKRGAILINTSRGAIVEEQELIRLLRTGHLGAAGLDVFQEEPLPPDSELRKLDNVVLTPHIGWRVEEVFYEFAEIAARQLEEQIRKGQ